MFMSELFSVPIFAFSEDALRKRYHDFEKRMRKEFDSMPEEMLRNIVDHETFPQRSTLLNHVIGYMTVSFFGNDLYFDVYLPIKEQRYIWNSKQRSFIQNTTANCIHFNYDLCMDNNEIQEKAWNMMNEIIAKYVPKRCYIDVKRLFNLNHSINYIRLIEMAKKEK